MRAIRGAAAYDARRRTHHLAAVVARDLALGALVALVGAELLEAHPRAAADARELGASAEVAVTLVVKGANPYVTCQY